MHSAINVLIGQLVEFLNIGKNMTVPQIQQTAELIISEKPYLSIEDLKICFKKIKSGEYGELYDVLDGHKLFTFLTRYEKERDQEAEHQSFMRHSKLKHGKGDEVIEMHPESKRICEEIKARLEADIANDRAEKLKKLGAKNLDYRNYSPEQKWMSTFDILFKKKRETVGGFKFIERNGVKMSMTEYLSFRSKKFIKLLNHEIKQ